ncbi:MAG TPA: septal ring lytic transglycosylase RlpA family protein [Bacteroidota bacterium]|nr:septal ring lytic transglycosylase RlpA family protein [Bacteroidota bacterium]
MIICSRTSGCALVGVFLLFGCSSAPRFAEKESDKGARKTVPVKAREDPPAGTSSSASLLTIEGIASYYADDFNGKQAADGELFDMNDLTAAHRTFPFGTKVRVTNLENNLSVVVRVIDRGPYVEGRMIDLSLAAAKRIELVGSGTARVRLEVLQWGKGTLYH